MLPTLAPRPRARAATRSRTALGALFFAGCAVLGVSSCAPAPVGVAEEAIAIPGDWAPPPATLAISDPQYVEVVEPPPVLPLGSCTSTNPWVGTCTHPECIRAHPGTTELDVYIRTRWPYVGAGGTYTCRRNSNPASTAYLSVHSVGRAIDLMIARVGGDADNTAGDAVANWLIENAEYIGIQRVIWDGWYWNGSRRGNHFSQISDATNADGSYRTDHHTNHIHVELSVDGAMRRTRFFTEGAPPTTCPVVCYGTAAVRADCSFTDCAATGEVCLPDPVRCGAGAPPEPSEASHNPGAPLPGVSSVAGLSRFGFVAPSRLFDTRTEASSTLLSRSDGATSGPLTGTRSGTVSSFGGLPAGASSVWLNVTAVPMSAPGFLVAFAAGPQPPISTLNFAPPRVRANAVAVALGAGGGVTFSANVDVDVIADLTGAFAPTGLGLLPAGPLRVMDSRSSDTALVPGVPFAVDVGAPAGAVGVVASVAVIQGGVEGGFVTAFPCGAAVPSTSNLNFTGSSVSANTVISELGAGQVCFVATQPVHLVVDVTGFLVPTGELSYQALSPVRILDTRDPSGLYGGRVGAGQILELPIQALPGMPPDVRAVVANITTVSPGTRGFVTAFPCGIAPPSTSSLNFDSDAPAGALTVSRTGSGSLCLHANARTHLIVDVLGVWVPTPDAPPPTDGPGPIPDEPDEPGPPDELDAGLDADGGATDAGEVAALDGGRSDAGPRGAIASTCGCRAPGPRVASASAAALSVLLLGLLGATRSRSRARRAAAGRARGGIGSRGCRDAR